MSTTFHFTVSCPENQIHRASRCLEECHKLVTELESELTEFQPQSPIYLLNHSDPLEPVKFPESALHLLLLSEKLRDESQGAFDCLAKSKDRTHRPRWDEGKSLVWRPSRETHLGFGAIGKGYAIDRVRTLVAQHGFENFCLEAGGSSLCLSGFSSEEKPWQIAWRTGASEGYVFPHFSGKSVGIGISGREERGDHLISTGEARPQFKSTLVLHESATHADALSTALFVGGWKAIEQNKSLGAATMSQDSKVETNAFFAKWFLAIFWLIPTLGFCDEVVDLGDAAASFNPYLFDRNPLWILLPALSLILVFMHLRKDPENVRSHNDDDSL